MKAIIVKQPGGREQLEIGEVAVPEPKENELLVKVKAAGINRADIGQREGKYPPPKGESEILGLEIAGVVEKVGNNCGDWKKGDKVFGLIPGGGYAEYAVINSETAMRIPDNLSFIEAAAIPEVFLTAYQTIFWLGELKPHQRILIHAGGSGVGTAAIQLAQEIDAEILVTAGSEEKLNVCRRLGASILINYKEGPFLQRVLDATNGEGVNLILDFIGAPYWEQNIKALSNEGRLILISMLGGATVEGFNLNYFLMKNLEVIGTTLRSRSVDYKIRLTKEFSNFALPRFQDGRLYPIIDKVFPLNKVADAHQYMEENKNIGKIILSITS